MGDQLAFADTPGRTEGGWFGSAAYSPDGVYRYELVRRWGSADGPLLRWVLLNPSTATETVLDPTLRRCRAYTIRVGFPGMVIHNVFGLRSTDPKLLYRHPDPVGPDTDRWLANPGEPIAPVTVVGWGAHARLADRAAAVTALLQAADVRLVCLGVTRGGFPRHPLYLPASRTFEVFPAPADTTTWDLSDLGVLMGDVAAGRAVQ